MTLTTSFFSLLILCIISFFFFFYSFHIIDIYFLEKDYPEITHSWDVWHGAKNMGRKISKASIKSSKLNSTCISAICVCVCVCTHVWRMLRGGIPPIYRCCDILAFKCMCVCVRAHVCGECSARGISPIYRCCDILAFNCMCVCVCVCRMLRGRFPQFIDAMIFLHK